jgi:GT2 family glycosyltransferase
MSMSVIIPTKNRPSDLETAVQSVLAQNVLPAQLIIVDQSDDEGSRSRLCAAYKALPAPIRSAVRLDYVLDPHITGLTMARNYAMDLAQGNIWLFLDDDVVLEPGFLGEVLLAYERHPEATGVSGIVTNYKPPHWPSCLWAGLFVRGPFRDERQAIYWNASSLRDANPVRVSRLGGGLMSFRAQAVRSARFDDNLRGVSDGEDVDFCLQLGPEANLLIVPRARLAHHHSASGRLRDHWLRRFARSQYYLYRRHWRRGVKNRLCFLWLNVGLGIVATAASLRRASLRPWLALAHGAQEGCAACPR